MRAPSTGWPEPSTTTPDRLRSGASRSSTSACSPSISATSRQGLRMKPWSSIAACST